MRLGTWFSTSEPLCASAARRRSWQSSSDRSQLIRTLQHRRRRANSRGYNGFAKKVLWLARREKIYENAIQFRCCTIGGSFVMLWRAALESKRQRRWRRKNHGHRKTRWHGSPHEGHRHVEGLLLRQGSCQRSGALGNRGGWFWWRAGKCGSLPLRRLERQRAHRSSRSSSSIRPKELRVYASCVSARHQSKIQSDNQRPDDSQHSPESQSDDRQHSVEPVSATRGCGSREELESGGSDSGTVQYSPLDARLVRSGERSVRDYRCQRRLHHQQRSSRQLYSDRVAGRLGHSDAKSDGCRRWRGICQLHLQGEVGSRNRNIMLHKSANRRS